MASAPRNRANEAAMTPIPFTRDLVLVGGGHSPRPRPERHFGIEPPVPGLRPQRSSTPVPRRPIPAMLPGHVAGHYDRDSLENRPSTGLAPLRRRAASCRQCHGPLDLAAREVHLRLGAAASAMTRPLSTSEVTSALPELPGSPDHGRCPPSPMGPLAHPLGGAFLGRGAAAGKRPAAVIRGGLCRGCRTVPSPMAHRLRAGSGATQRVHGPPNADHASPAALAPAAERRLRERLEGRRGIVLREGVEVAPGSPPTRSSLSAARTGSPPPSTVSAAGPHARISWLAETGLGPPRAATIHRRPLPLQSIRPRRLRRPAIAPNLAFAPPPRPGSLRAVRAAPVLSRRNLTAALAGRAAPASSRPQRDYLKLIYRSGRRPPVAEKAGAALSGPMASGV